MIKPMYHCDGPSCKEVRKEANHWFRIYVSAGVELCIRRWEVEAEQVASAPSYEMHACGESCLQKLVSQWITTGRLELSAAVQT